MPTFTLPSPGATAHNAHHDSPGRADHVLDRLMEVAESLATFPERGSHPRELSALGIREYC